MNIDLKNIGKKYGEKFQLNISNFQFKKGKIYGIIGPNGAGKSTMLKIIGNLEEKSSGNILYDEKELTSEIFKKMTYLTQKPYLFNTTVFNNIAYPLKFRKYKKKDINYLVNKTMEEFQIQELSDQLATSLSGGEGQKVALARALIFQPELLLLDEPTANIDPNFIEQIEKIILRTNIENNTTILFITHNVSQAKRVCEEIIFVDRGQILEAGKTENMLFKPKTIEARRYLSLEYYVS